MQFVITIASITSRFLNVLYGFIVLLFNDLDLTIPILTDQNGWVSIHHTSVSALSLFTVLSPSRTVLAP